MMARSPTPPAPMQVSPESLLLEYLKKLSRRQNGRHFCRVRLSVLPQEAQQSHRIKAAISLFDGLLRDKQLQLFALSNNDLFLGVGDVGLDDVKVALIKLRFMFDDEKLGRDDRHGENGFIRWYSGDRDFHDLLALAQSLMLERRKRRQEEAATEELSLLPARRQPAHNEPLSPLMLAKLRNALGGADLSRMIRRQAVCALVGCAKPQPLFHEIFVSIAELGEAVLPHVEIAANPWLFQMLTETLDRRVLAHLMRREDKTLNGDVSINLTVQTLLSPAFQAFDEGIKANQRYTIVFELQSIDIFADLGAFQSARDFARERGYRICIDGVTHDSLPFIDRQRLGVDLLKLTWDKALIGARFPAGGLDEYVRRCGQARMILCRCDDPYAVDLGQTAGISLFQGRHIEELLSRQKSPDDIRGSPWKREV